METTTQLTIIEQLRTLSPEDVIRAVQEGELDPIQVATICDLYRKSAEKIRKGIEDLVITAIERQGGKSVVVQNAKLSIMESGVKYDYSVSPVWVRLNQACKKADAARKEHEEMLKTIKSHTILTDPETGETFELYGVPKSSKTTFKIE